MKGMVFTEFLEMVEETFSVEVVDQIIEASALSSHGVYTAVGSYDHAELLQLVTHLSEITGSGVPDLIASVWHLFGRFVAVSIFRGGRLCLYISATGGKLYSYRSEKIYPDAELRALHVMPLTLAAGDDVQIQSPFC